MAGQLVNDLSACRIKDVHRPADGRSRESRSVTRPGEPDDVIADRRPPRGAEPILGLTLRPAEHPVMVWRAGAVRPLLNLQALDDSTGALRPPLANTDYAWPLKKTTASGGRVSGAEYGRPWYCIVSACT